ncbi:bifunctional riboflavin kinase/FAD synthetase [Waterburya agarophytonicola K14]|uniref:Riboflavin biosynthesis protein n=1 Tax=Waterburya agarophytonicola KI4 TaxID=2874699 RepID=A0A964FHZ5_9CYAN|nr:bifunctional riboflavin kinase/FAD synthetase [Waterburya agarophytonicola KI4]
MLIVSSPDQIKTPTAIALGNFDGIHQGHQIVLQPIIQSFQVQPQNDLQPSVVSFTPHPREFFSGGKLQLLTPIPEKAEELSILGIKQLILLAFDRKMASLSPQEFIEEIIVKQLQAKIISVGADFRFGYQRKGMAEDLKNIAGNFGITVHLNSLHKYEDRDRQAVRVSSSLIRQALSKGEIKQANKMLGRPYSLMGKVVTGQQLGRTIGFPTANLALPPEKFLPRYGVYAVDVFLNQNLEQNIIKGVMNVGCRPTVAGETPTIEVHLLNWSGDLYGRDLKVNLLQFLRPEQKFDSVEALKQQITQDCQAVLNN